ncbi:response regulator [Sphingomonas ginsenosidimutans]|jgi:FixJ family two-component response regulator|uniref:Response regulator n=1 Tax=Sphingomonas ginsenosidimutans TaxID=862134 RepID=A0A2A4I228_9SPHN|nr:response regulator [Sphingomonas ginsenosidimutans]MEE2916214.1 response regulator [Pseudomonadota bacterium]PCG09977.1 response regulator [Sphingomonas ginsenosidimutans]
MTTDPPPEHRRAALVVEDDDGVRRSLQLLLHWRGYEVRSFASAGALLAGADLDDAAVLIADFRLPDATGCDVRRALGDRGWTGRSVLITGYPSAALDALARDSGFDAVLSKPLRQQALFSALREDEASARR